MSNVQTVPMNHTATVSRFRLPCLLIIGRHVFYLLSKMGTAKVCGLRSVWKSQSFGC